MTPLGLLKAPAGDASVDRFFHSDDGTGQRKRKADPDVGRRPGKRETGVVIDVEEGLYAGAKLSALEVRRHFEPTH
eukprot:6990487-Prymnesium_polylepis.1